MRPGIFALLTFLLVGCASGYDEYGDTADMQPMKIGVQNLYSVDANGKLRRDTRMEQIQNRGDNSSDEGAKIGW